MLVSRLAALDAFLERGVLTTEAHARERQSILDGLLPLIVPDPRAVPASSSPALEDLVQAGLITRDEAVAERMAASAGSVEPLSSPSVAAATQAPAIPPLPSPKPEAATAEDSPAPAATTAWPAAGGTVGLHLASYRTPEQAELGWSELLAANLDLLGGLRSHIAEVDRGADTGVYFEVRAGPLPDLPAALAVCEALVARGRYCAATDF